MIEAELKAVLDDPDVVRAALAQRGEVERSTYSDRYYDDADGGLDASGRELRIRTKTTGDRVRHLLTIKEAAVDEETGSKPEHESDVADPDAVAAGLATLRFTLVIAFTKLVENYEFQEAGRTVLASVVTVPEIHGSFIEIETMVDPDDVASALDDLRSLLGQLGVPAAALTTETYTGAVAAARKTLPQG